MTLSRPFPCRSHRLRRRGRPLLLQVRDAFFEFLSSDVASAQSTPGLVLHDPAMDGRRWRQRQQEAAAVPKPQVSRRPDVDVLRDDGYGTSQTSQPVRSDGEALLHASRRSPQERDFGGDLEQVLGALTERFPERPQDSGRGRRPGRRGRHLFRWERRKETSGGPGTPNSGSSGRRDTERG